MLREVFRTATEITSLNPKMGIITWKETLITENESLSPTALSELFSTAGEFEIKKGQRMYFFPGCTAPRFKVRQLCQKEDMAIVRTPEKATVSIVGDQTTSELVRSVHYNYVFNKADIVDVLKASNVHSTSYLGFIDHLTNKENLADEVIIPSWSFKSYFTDAGASCWSEGFWTAGKTDLVNFDMVMDLGVPFVTQDSLLKFVTQGTLMTREMHDEIDNMFNSSDKNNHILAMEIMANCDYEKSALYLLQLLSNNRTKITVAKEKNHVNFQSLCKFFNTEPGTHLSLDGRLQRLAEKKLINSSIKKELLEMAAENYDLQESTYFKTELVTTEELELEIEKGDAYMKSREEPTLDLTTTEELNENPQNFDI
jgi:hypothetical protein